MMKRTIEESIPQLMGLNKMGEYRLMEITSIWDSLQITSAIENVPSCYENLTEEKMSDYTGLLIFTTIVNIFRRGLAWQHHKIKEMAQRKVLHYHNKQYERNDNSNPGLLEENKDFK